MAEEVVRDCVICCEQYNYSAQFPMQPRCNDKHAACSNCLLNMVKSDRCNHAIVTCPMCRDETSIDCWKPHCKTVEDVEVLALKDYQESLTSAASYRCSFCEKENPFTDYQICLTCNPDLITHLRDENLDNLYNHMVCSACDVYHTLCHGKKGHYPLMVPPHVLMLKDIPHLVTIITSAFDAWKIDPNGPLVGLVLLCRYLANPEKLDRKILQYMYSIPEGEYFKRDCSKQMGDVKTVYKLFCFYYLEAVKNVVRIHPKELSINDLDKARTSLGWVGYVSSQWLPETVLSLWFDALPLFNDVYNLTNRFDYGLPTDPKKNLILGIVRCIQAYSNCPGHGIIWKIYFNEHNAYHGFMARRGSTDLVLFLEDIARSARLAQKVFVRHFPIIYGHPDDSSPKV